MEARRWLRIGGVVLALETRHLVERVICRNVRVNDAVPQSLRWFLAQRLRIAVDHPVDGTVTDGVHAHVQTGVVIQLDERAQRVGISGWIAAIAGIGAGEILVPLVVEPRRARATAAIGVQLHTAGNDAIVARAEGKPRCRATLVDETLRRGDAVWTAPQREHAHSERAVGE